MSTKILTFLGTGEYKKATYHLQGGEGYCSHFIQEALYEVLKVRNPGKTYELLICLTGEAKEKNWNPETIEISKSGETYEGLVHILNRREIPYKVIDIFSGENEEELWENFIHVSEYLGEGDEVIMDITHSFRSIPVIFLSVLNYNKLLKDINIAGIFYGAWESAVDGHAPIFNLTMFDHLTDWADATSHFMESGRSSALERVIHSMIEPKLKNGLLRTEELIQVKKAKKALKGFSEDIHSVRGKSVGKSAVEAREALIKVRKTDTMELKPLEKIVDRIIDQLEPFTYDASAPEKNMVENLIHITDLCVEFDLIQQGYTFLRENIINAFCRALGEPVVGKRLSNPDSSEKKLLLRDLVEDLLNTYYSPENLKGKTFDELFGKIDNPLLSELISRVHRSPLEKEGAIQLGKTFDKVRNFRNDLNHGGFRADASKPLTLRTELRELNREFERIIRTID